MLFYVLATVVLAEAVELSRNSTEPTVPRATVLQCHYEKPPIELVHHFGGDDFGESTPVECDGGFCIKFAHRNGVARGCSQVGIGLSISGYCRNMSTKNSCMNFEGGQLCCCNDQNLCNASRKVSTSTSLVVLLLAILYLTC